MYKYINLYFNIKSIILLKTDCISFLKVTFVTSITNIDCLQ